MRLLLCLLLVGCAPGFVYSRAALEDETPFSAEVRSGLEGGTVRFNDVGAVIIASKKTPEALEIIQCLACHRAADHPPLDRDRDQPKHEWKEAK